VISILICHVFSGCPGALGQQPGVEIRSGIVPMTVVIEDAENYHFYFLPGCTEPAVYPKEQVKAYWHGGLLIDGADGVEWLDFDPESCEYVTNPGVDLTKWETPIAVDPGEKIIYAFGHTTPPARAVEAHYLDGREFTPAGSLAAEIVEPLDLFTTNGWPVFRVDRPGQAGTNLLEDIPTRKLRIHSGKYYAGEYYGVIDWFALNDNVIINSESEGWIILEREGIIVRPRTLSFSQMPGELTPYGRAGDELLVYSDELLATPHRNGEANEAGRNLFFSYGIYSRAVSEIWEPERTVYDAGSDGTDFYALLMAEPYDHVLTVERITSGTPEEIVKISTGRNSIYDAHIVFGSQVPFEIPEEPEPVQDSGVEEENLVQ